MIVVLASFYLADYGLFVPTGTIREVLSLARVGIRHQSEIEK